MTKFANAGMNNIVGNEENAGYQHLTFSYNVLRRFILQVGQKKSLK